MTIVVEVDTAGAVAEAVAMTTTEAAIAVRRTFGAGRSLGLRCAGAAAKGPQARAATAPPGLHTIVQRGLVGICAYTLLAHR